MVADFAHHNKKDQVGQISGTNGNNFVIIGYSVF